MQLCENKHFCNVVMLSEESKKLKFNQYQQSDKAPFNVYADREFISNRKD